MSEIVTGTHHSSGRRRRRLVNDDQELLEEFAAISSRGDLNSGNTHESLQHVVSDELLPRLISARLWKHCAFIVVASLLAIAAFVVEKLSGILSEPVNSAGTADTRLCQGLSGIYLLISGQTAILIGWIRRRSAVDFNGRYRWWKWLGTLVTTAGVLYITNSVGILPSLAVSLAEPIIGNVSAARHALIIVPAAALMIVVLGRIIPDMSRNRVAQAGFCMAIATALAHTIAGSAGASNAAAPQMQAGLLLVTTTTMLASLMLHARFVLYISNDPPVSRTTGSRSVAARADSAMPAPEPDSQSTGISDASPDNISQTPSPAEVDKPSPDPKSVEDSKTTDNAKQSASSAAASDKSSKDACDADKQSDSGTASKASTTTSSRKQRKKKRRAA